MLTNLTRRLARVAVAAAVPLGLLTASLAAGTGTAAALPPKCSTPGLVAKSVVCGTAVADDSGTGRTAPSSDLPTKPPASLPSYKGYDRDRGVFVWE